MIRIPASTWPAVTTTKSYRGVERTRFERPKRKEVRLNDVPGTHLEMDKYARVLSSHMIGVGSDPSLDHIDAIEQQSFSLKRLRP